MSTRIHRRNTEVRFVAKRGENRSLQSCQKVVSITTQKKNSGSAGLVPAHFAKNGLIAPKIPWTLSPLDLSTYTEFGPDRLRFAGKIDFSDPKSKYNNRLSAYKYIAVISWKEYHEGDAKLLTQQTSASANQCSYFITYELDNRHVYCKAQNYNWQLQLNQTDILACNCLTGQRQQERLQLSLQKQCQNQKQCSKWPPPALMLWRHRRAPDSLANWHVGRVINLFECCMYDARWETTTPLMHSSCNDGVIQLTHSVLMGCLSSIEISHACFVHLLLQYVPHSVVNWI